MFDDILSFFGLCRESKFLNLKTEFKEVSKLYNDTLNSFRNRAKLSSKYEIKVYRDKKEEFRWRLVSKNNKIIAEGGEGYKTRRALYRSLEILRKIFYSVPLEEEE